MIAYDAKRAENIVTLVFEALSGRRGSAKTTEKKSSKLKFKADLLDFFSVV